MLLSSNELARVCLIRMIWQEIPHAHSTARSLALRTPPLRPALRSKYMLH